MNTRDILDDIAATLANLAEPTDIFTEGCAKFLALHNAPCDEGHCLLFSPIDLPLYVDQKRLPDWIKSSGHITPGRVFILSTAQVDRILAGYSMTEAQADEALTRVLEWYEKAGR